MRREAQYSSFWAIVPKFIAIPSAALPLALLSQLGYVPNQAQSPEVLFAMRAIFLAPALVGLVAWVIALRFPMTEQVHVRVLAGIAAHQRGETAVDPITGTELPPPGARRVEEETGWLLDHFSSGELRRVLRRGAGRLSGDVVAAALASLGVCAATVFWVLGQLGDPSQEPGTLVTLAVVLSGLALTGFLFHALRLGPARRLRRNLPDAEVLRAALALRGSGSAAPASSRCSDS